MRRFLTGLLAAGLVLFALAGARRTRRQGRRSAAPAPAPKLDVELAFDGTESMGNAIAQAQAAGVGILNGVVSLLPDTEFSVVVFRDHGNPAGELPASAAGSPSDTGVVKTAIGKIKTSYNPCPCNGLAESYNLAFHESYSDSALGWRPDSRKIVVVFGDAEPNGVGTEKLPGCKDTFAGPRTPLDATGACREASCASLARHGPGGL